MKRFWMIFFLLPCLFLSACASSPATSDIMARAITELDDMPGSRLIYYSNANPDTEHYLDQTHATQIYYEGFDIYALCDDFTILIGSADTPYEIHILRARASSNVPEILSALQTRKDMLQLKKSTSYNPDAYEATLSSAKAYSQERYVFLLVTTDNTAAENAIDKAW